MTIEIGNEVFIKSLKTRGRVIGRVESTHSVSNESWVRHKGDLIVAYESLVRGKIQEIRGYFNPSDLEVIHDDQDQEQDSVMVEYQEAGETDK